MNIHKVQDNQTTLPLSSTSLEVLFFDIDKEEKELIERTIEDGNVYLFRGERFGKVFEYIITPNYN